MRYVIFCVLSFLFAVLLWLNRTPAPVVEIKPTNFLASITETLQTELSPLLEAAASNKSNDEPSTIDLKFGHFAYEETDQEKLVYIASYGQYEYQRFEKLMPEAALAMMQMIYAARDDGVWIIPASAFRSVDKQQKLFERRVQRQGSPEAAAKSVAPPGFSEHHTGYAVDFVDGSNPEADINSNFVYTKGFQWLMQRAGEFGYELSFPENNAQNIKFEPWHWRFIGSANARTIFEKSNIISSQP